MKNRLSLLALLLLVCLRPASAGIAPDFEAARLTAVAANPPGVSLTLSLPPGRTQFRQGEVIPLTATFVSRLPKAYRLNAGPGLSGSGDRELPWNSDTFQVDNTTGAVDPLTIYYVHELGWGFSGGGPQFQDLEAQPVLIPYTLNEWLRFDAPGHYRVYLTSGRIIKAGGPRQVPFLFHGRAMASNAVDLEVLPRDPIQDAQTLKQALPLFNADGFDSRVQQAKEAAVRAVRFLGTPDAVRAMVARYGQFTDYRQLNYFAYRQTRLGLFGFPQPSVVVQEMGRRLADPDFPVFSIFLEDLAQTQLFAAYPQPLPPYNVADPEQNRIRQRSLGLRRDALAALTEQNRGRLAAAVLTKQGKAQAISLYTLRGADYAHPDTVEYKVVERALVPAFDDLTLEEQNNRDTPLLEAAFHGDPKVIALLLQYGAKVNAEDMFGENALHKAVFFSGKDAVALLIAHGADVKHKDHFGKTALHVAAQSNDPDKVSLLLAHGADVNARDEEGKTPLAVAVASSGSSPEHIATIKLLRQHGGKK